MLNNLFLLSSAETRSISAENPTGGRGMGAMAIPDENSPASEMGQGWKVSPSITLEPGSVTTLADIEGPGVIQHIWMTVKPEFYQDISIRNITLCIYWDDAKYPFVHAPLDSFFCQRGYAPYSVNSLPVVANSIGGLNCYWPMPFRRRAKIVIRNDGSRQIDHFFYQITYSLESIPSNASYFHALSGHHRTAERWPNYIVSEVSGEGHYVGTFLSWEEDNTGWWGEGEVKFYIDDDSDFPTICGTGIEDYFGGAWCLRDGLYSTPFLGYPARETIGAITRHNLYRWHILDPIRFGKRLRVLAQTIGWAETGKFKPLPATISSVAYWYQAR